MSVPEPVVAAGKGIGDIPFPFFCGRRSGLRGCMSQANKNIGDYRHIYQFSQLLCQ